MQVGIVVNESGETNEFVLVENSSSTTRCKRGLECLETFHLDTDNYRETLVNGGKVFLLPWQFSSKKIKPARSNEVKSNEVKQNEIKSNEVKSNKIQQDIIMEQAPEQNELEHPEEKQIKQTEQVKTVSTTSSSSASTTASAFTTSSVSSSTSMLDLPRNFVPPPNSCAFWFDLGLIQCNVCYSFLSKEIFHCKSGHFLCSPCIEILKQTFLPGRRNRFGNLMLPLSERTLNDNNVHNNNHSNNGSHNNHNSNNNSNNNNNVVPENELPLIQGIEHRLSQQYQEQCLATEMFSCPICRQIGPIIRNRTIEQMLQQRIHSCRNKQCTELIFDFHIEQHLKEECIYGRFQCRRCDHFIESCNEQDIRPHIEKLCTKTLYKELEVNDKEQITLNKCNGFHQYLIFKKRYWLFFDYQPDLSSADKNEGWDLTIYDFDHRVDPNAALNKTVQCIGIEINHPQRKDLLINVPIYKIPFPNSTANNDIRQESARIENEYPTFLSLTFNASIYLEHSKYNCDDILEITTTNNTTLQNNTSTHNNASAHNNTTIQNNTSSVTNEVKKMKVIKRSRNILILGSCDATKLERITVRIDTINQPGGIRVNKPK